MSPHRPRRGSAVRGPCTAPATTEVPRPATPTPAPCDAVPPLPAPAGLPVAGCLDPEVVRLCHARLAEAGPRPAHRGGPWRLLSARGAEDHGAGAMAVKPTATATAGGTSFSISITRHSFRERGYWTGTADGRRGSQGCADQRHRGYLDASRANSRIPPTTSPAPGQPHAKARRALASRWPRCCRTAESPCRPACVIPWRWQSTNGARYSSGRPHGHPAPAAVKRSTVRTARGGVVTGRSARRAGPARLQGRSAGDAVQPRAEQIGMG
jgi:hypothetical protein